MASLLTERESVFIRGIGRLIFCGGWMALAFWWSTHVVASGHFLLGDDPGTSITPQMHPIGFWLGALAPAFCGLGLVVYACCWFQRHYRRVYSIRDASSIPGA